MFLYYERIWRTGLVAQEELFPSTCKALQSDPHSHEDLSVDPKYYVRSQTWHMLIIPVLWGPEGRSLGLVVVLGF